MWPALWLWQGSSVQSCISSEPWSTGPFNRGRKDPSKYSYHLTQLLKIKDANPSWCFFYLHRKNVTCKTICLPHIGKSKCMLTVDDF